MTKKDLKKQLLEQVERFEEIADNMTQRSKEAGNNFNYIGEYFDMICGVLHFGSCSNIITYQEFNDLVKNVVDWKYKIR